MTTDGTITSTREPYGTRRLAEMLAANERTARPRQELSPRAECAGVVRSVDPLGPELGRRLMWVARPGAPRGGPAIEGVQGGAREGEQEKTAPDHPLNEGGSKRGVPVTPVSR